jgi:hypothetical protein
MIQWQSSAQLAYSGGEFADLFRRASEWSVVSHIPVTITSAVESVAPASGRLDYALEVVLEIKTGRPQELQALASFLGSRLEPAWTLTVQPEAIRCEFATERRPRVAPFH